MSNFSDVYEDWDYSGHYNKETGILLWDDIEYEKISE